jgi:NADPH:quinone reductase-like Zn-dependent oxidoreductase
MRAIACTRYGRPADVLQPADVDVPTLGDDQVLVAVRAASVNPADWHLIRGNPYLARLQIGLRRPSFQVPGSDFAGVVEAVGAAVTTVRPGDDVYGTTFMAGFGAFAERAAVPERLLAARPRSASFVEAAAMPLAAATALQALRDHGKVQQGQRVLIIGASGGVGTYAVQLAKHLGATVTGVCSTKNLDLVRSLGANHVIDYTTDDITESTERFDVIVQVAGTQTARRLRRLLTPQGTLVQLSGDSPNRWVGPLGRILGGRLGAIFSAQTVTTFTVKPRRDDLELLASLYDGGVLRSELDRTYELGDVAHALEHLETGRTRGKVAITVTSTPEDLVNRGEEAVRLC